ncbi:MAG: hypothetical protein LBF84_02425 [Holosporales bacterium]|jgi:hypothetical protein|nr:hypothetical protein [Holosporales bacterium]
MKLEKTNRRSICRSYAVAPEKSELMKQYEKDVAAWEVLKAQGVPAKIIQRTILRLVKNTV